METWTYKKAYDAELKRMQEQAVNEFNSLKKNKKRVDKILSTRQEALKKVIKKVIGND